MIMNGWWILSGIIVPLAAILTEKITQICASTFFDPTPTDWHLLLIALVPITNLLGELLLRPSLSARMGWVNRPTVKWLNGMAIGVSGFYALWFMPVTLLCVFLLGASVVGALTMPFFLLNEVLHGRMENVSYGIVGCIAIPFMELATVGLFLLPAAPLMSCLACIRMRRKLCALDLENAPASPDVQTVESRPRSTITLGPFVLDRERAIQGGIFYVLYAGLLYYIWFPYVRSEPALLTTNAVGFGALPLWVPPGLMLLACVLPTRLSPFQWFTRLNAPGKSKISYGRVWLPVVCGLLALIAIEIPSTATRVAMNMALNPNTRAQGLLILRAFGNDESMLRACYEKAHATDILGSVLTGWQPVSKDSARELYYRATGIPFNSRSVPKWFRGKSQGFDSWNWTDEDDVFDSDADLAGETVGGVVRGVTLPVSEITGTIDASRNVAAMNWTMEFKNDSKYQREARVQILLPPGAVVSNALLWINGMPSAAVFGSRGQTRAAYQAVVRSRRDPLLVTTYGPDRVLAQCYPVPPKGSMRIQLAITAPLLIQSTELAYLPLPVMLERNFQVKEHSLKFASGEAISCPTGALKANKESELLGSLSNADLFGGKGTIAVKRPAGSDSSWCLDPYDSSVAIGERVFVIPQSEPDDLVVVVDGSAAMAEQAPKIAAMLSKTPHDFRVSLLRAGDNVETLAQSLPNASDAAWGAALQSLQYQTFVGGQDDTSALLRALELIGPKRRGAILWLHGPQPVKIDDAKNLAARLNLVKDTVTLYELPLENGPNRTIEALDGVSNVQRLPIVISADATIANLFSLWTGKSERFRVGFDVQK
jgi:hypothetical protein